MYCLLFCQNSQTFLVVLFFVVSAKAHHVFLLHLFCHVHHMLFSTSKIIENVGNLLVRSSFHMFFHHTVKICDLFIIFHIWLFSKEFTFYILLSVEGIPFLVIAVFPQGGNYFYFLQSLGLSLLGKSFNQQFGQNVDQNLQVIPNRLD